MLKIHIIVAGYSLNRESLKGYAHKEYLHFRRKGLERLTFCNKFYENRWIGFEDMAMCILNSQCLTMVAAILFTFGNGNLLIYMIWFSFCT